MKFVDIIAKKKRGEEHSEEEIKFLTNGIVNNSIPDYQLSAWLMAVCLKGMTFKESAILTREMVNSGDVLDLSSIGKCVADKHSTGGVGDKITLILIPLLAVCGLPMAKLSGRGLGHTGGTIDKLESIPNFNTSIPMEEFLNQVKKIGCAIGGQTAKLAPADKKLYALRDVTATVDAMPLIASSVVSKKVASGANLIVLDVKYGNGAFIKTKEDAEELSKIMVEIGKLLNRSIVAVITSMEEPLGCAVGNALEVIESVNTLKNKGPKDIVELTFELGSVLLVNSGIASDSEKAKEMMKKHISDGSAFNKFKELVEFQGGNSNALEDFSLLPQAKTKYEFLSEQSGFVNYISAIDIAVASKLLGAGRDKKEDDIDFAVGVVLNKKVGDEVQKGEPLATLYINNDARLEEAKEHIKKAFVIENDKKEKEPLIYKKIS